MELAKLIVYVAVLAASLTAYTWWAAASHRAAPDTAQALLNDICSLAGTPVNTSIEAVYTLPGTLEIGPGTLTAPEALAPQCGAMYHNGTHYTYTLPISPAQPQLTLRGAEKLTLIRTPQGVLVRPP